MSEPVHVGCFGKDQRLLRTREAVLAREFKTTPVETLVSLLKISYECAFEIAVLCHTLSESDYDQAITLLHSCCPRAGIVALTTNLPRSSRVGADRTLRGLDGPEALISTIRALLADKRVTDSSPAS